MRIGLFSHTPFGGTFRVGSYHLARELSALGHSVWHVDPPARLWLPSSRRSSRRVLQNLGDFDPIVVSVSAPAPLHVGPAAARHLNDRWIHRSLARSHPELAELDIALVDQPRYIGVVRLLAPRSVVYRPTDVHERTRERVPERIAVSCADGVVATSAAALESLGPLSCPNMVLSNGVEFDRFAIETDANRSGAVYVGSLDERIDWTTIAALAEARPETSIMLIGPVRGQVPPQPSNVRFLGAIAYEDLPVALAKASVGLLPFLDSVRNHSRSPMKYYEYLASGLWVLGRQLNSIDRHREDGVSLYRTTSEAVTLWQGLAPMEAQLNHSGREGARRMDWHRRAIDLSSFLDHVVGDSSRRG